GDYAAIAQRFVAANANPTAPSARTNNRAEFELFEAKGEGFAIAASLSINQAGQVTVEGTGGYRVDIAAQRASDGEDCAVELSEQHWRDRPTVIPAVIHDHTSFAPLRRVVASKLPQPAPAHVIKMNVADLALTLFIDILTVFTHPVGVSNTRVLGDG